jgi:fimbrial chaperone protein
MPKFRSRFWALVVAILGLVLSQAEVANASTFEVNPIRLTLTESSSRGLLTVRNVSQEVLRFQVSAFAWSQDRAGAMRLSPTQDIVFFPAMIALKPGETRNIRVGTMATVGPKEKAYRIFVEELPPPAGSVSNGIRVLTRFGIPVFLHPSAAKAAAPRVRGLALHGQALSFAVENEGGTHFLPRSVRIRVQDQAGRVLLDQSLPAWYVLAGEGRDYTLALPASACGAARLVVSVDDEKRSLETTLAMPANACSP